MTKKLIKPILFFLLITGFANAQAPLTKGQVYDFAVGDEFERQYIGGVNPEYFFERVLNKWPVPGSDSVAYEMERKKFEYDWQYNIIQVSQDTIVVQHGTLSQIWYLNYSQVLADSSDSTVYASPTYYNRVINHLKSFKTSPLNAGYGHTKWGEGLGLVYAIGYQPGNGIDFSWTLTYYKKGSEVYGGPALGLDGGQKGRLSRIFPNPVGEAFGVEISPELLEEMISYEICDMNGRVLVVGRMSPGELVDVADLSPGIYMLRVDLQGNKQWIRFLKK